MCNICKASNAIRLILRKYKIHNDEGVSQAMEYWERTCEGSEPEDPSEIDSEPENETEK